MANLGISHPSITYTKAFYSNVTGRISIVPTGTISVVVEGTTDIKWKVLANGQTYSVAVDGGSAVSKTLPTGNLIKTVALATGLSSVVQHTVVITISSATVELIELQTHAGKGAKSQRALNRTISLSPGQPSYKFWVDQTTTIDLIVKALGQKFMITIGGAWQGYQVQMPNTGDWVRMRLLWGMLPYPTQVETYSISGEHIVSKIILFAPAGYSPSFLEDDDPALLARPTLCVFGDSITLGQNTLGFTQTTCGYVHRLAMAKGWKVTNAGVGGQNAYCYGRDRAGWLPLRTPSPDMYLVAFGANDIVPGIGFDFGGCDPSIDDFDGAIRSIITTLKNNDPDKPVYVGGILPLAAVDDSIRNSWNTRISTACSDLSAKYLDVGTAASMNLSTDYSDGLHPHTGGHQKMADAWVSFFSNPVSPPAFGITATRDIGALSRPSNVARDVGLSAFPFGDKVLWMFGDTIISGSSSDNSHAFSARNTYLTMNQGAPDQFIPHTAFETSWNNANSPSDRYALWPQSLIPLADGKAIIFFSRMHLASSWTDTGVFWALADPSKPYATRGTTALFDGSQPRFNNGSCISRNGVYIYLYNSESTGGFNYGHRIARVERANYQDRSAYRFWNGSAWVVDSTQAVIIMNPGASSGLSVTWNAYLGKYLATYSKPLTSNIYMRTATSPEGPWSNETLAFTGYAAGGTGLGSVDYCALEHPEFATYDGKIVVVSYARSLGEFDSEIRLVKVTFQ